MNKIFNFFRDANAKALKYTFYTLSILGAVSLTIGIYIVRSQDRFELSSIPVNMMVIRMIEGSGGSKGSFAPRFVVVEGKHKGKSYHGNTYSRPPVHQVGDSVEGFYQKSSGAIRSKQMISQIRTIGWHLTWTGLIIALVGIGWGIVERLNRGKNI